MNIFGQPTSALEITAFITGLLSVWLTARMHVLNWPLGIVSVLCYLAVFVGAKLYADASLQVVYALLGLYGWVVWSRARSTQHDTARLNVVAMPLRFWCAGVALTALATIVFALILSRYTDSPVPWLDSLLTAASLLATWGQAKRDRISWWVWIGVDVIAVPLYWSRQLPLTSVLYFIFLMICFFGLRSWSAPRVRQQQSA